MQPENHMWDLLFLYWLGYLMFSTSLASMHFTFSLCLVLPFHLSSNCLTISFSSYLDSLLSCHFRSFEYHSTIVQVYLLSVNLAVCPARWTSFGTPWSCPSLHSAPEWHHFECAHATTFSACIFLYSSVWITGFSKQHNTWNYEWTMVVFLKDISADLFAVDLSPVHEN